MPPRLQCLNAARFSTKQCAFSVRAFSTGVRAVTDKPSSNATNDLLSSIDTQPTRVQLPIPKRRSANTSSSSSHSSPKPRAPGNPPGNAQANDRISSLIDRFSGTAASRKSSTSNVMQELRDHKLATDLTKQIQRRWKAGDVYAPHDLTSAEMMKWKRRGRPETDVFDLLDMNPVEDYKNFAIMSEYVTPMGRIMSSAETGLRRVNQRRIAKAIRRSIGLGLMPSVHRHPEILYKMNAKLRTQMGRMRVS